MQHPSSITSRWDWPTLEKHLLQPASGAALDRLLALGMEQAFCGHWPMLPPVMDQLIAQGANPQAAVDVLTQSRGNGWRLTSLCMDAWHWVLNQQLDLSRPQQNGLTLLQMLLTYPSGSHEDRVAQRFRDALWERGVDASIVTSEGRSALHEAALGGNAQWVEKLLMGNAPPDQCSKTGASPLSEAALSGSPKTVAALLEGGANLEKTQDCPLACAAWGYLLRPSSSAWEILDLLYKNGAHPLKACGSGNKSARDVLEEMPVSVEDESTQKAAGKLRIWIEAASLDTAVPRSLNAAKIRL